MARKSKCLRCIIFAVIPKTVSSEYISARKGLVNFCFGNPCRRLKHVLQSMLSNSDNDVSASVWLKFTVEKLWGGASILMQYGVLYSETRCAAIQVDFISAHNLSSKSVRQISQLSLLFLTILP